MDEESMDYGVTSAYNDSLCYYNTGSSTGIPVSQTEDRVHPQSLIQYIEEYVFSSRIPCEQIKWATEEKYLLLKANGNVYDTRPALEAAIYMVGYMPVEKMSSDLNAVMMQNKKYGTVVQFCLTLLNPVNKWYLDFLVPNLSARNDWLIKKRHIMDEFLQKQRGVKVFNDPVEPMEIDPWSTDLILSSMSNNYWSSPDWETFRAGCQVENNCAIAVVKRNNQENNGSYEENNLETSQGIVTNEIEDAQTSMSPMSQNVECGTYYGDVQVNVCSDRVSDHTADASVNEVSPDFNPDTTLTINGESANMVLTRFSKDPNICYASTCGRLPCKCIIFCKTPNNEAECLQRVMASLQCAEECHCSTVSVPLFAAEFPQNLSSLDPQCVSHCFAKALEKFSEKQHCYVKRVDICVRYSNHYPICCANIATNKEFEDDGKRQVELLQSQNALQNDTIIQISGHDLCSVNRVQQCIYNHVSNEIVSRSVGEEDLIKLSNSEIVDIYKSAKVHCVKVDYNRECRNSIIGLTGLKQNVMKVEHKIRDITCLHKQADLMKNVCIWKREGLYQQFTPLPLSVSLKIEQEYKKNPNGRTKTYLNGRDFEVDFQSNTFLFNSVHGRLKRVDVWSESLLSGLPSDWSDMGGKTCQVVELPRDSQEYMSVTANFWKSRPRVSRIVKIEKVQNAVLYKQYNVKRLEVEKHLLNGNTPTERVLYHATSAENAEKICKDGFNRSFAGTHGALYGKGTYFATTSHYSVNYTTTTANIRQPVVFVANVLTGDFIMGSGDMKEPPEKNVRGEKCLYDSVVNEQNNPEIFVVFKDCSAYPAYLLTIE